MPSAISVYSRLTLAPRPAPLTPDLASMMMSSFSISPSCSASRVTWPSSYCTVQYHSVPCPQAHLEKWVERQLHRSRVAARVGHQAGRLDLLSVNFRQPVYRLLLKLWR